MCGHARMSAESQWGNGDGFARRYVGDGMGVDKLYRQVCHACANRCITHAQGNDAGEVLLRCPLTYICINASRWHLGRESSQRSVQFSDGYRGRLGGTFKGLSDCEVVPTATGN